ncbi:MAG: hypothetical protein E7666_02230 [Ruminococcaceae bacterium]|nr:hypothetical protein [Oscillospiraceae bacterium]
MNCSEKKRTNYGLLTLCAILLCVLSLGVGLLAHGVSAEPAPTAADYNESYVCEVSGKSYVLYYSITGDSACVTDFYKDHASTVAVVVPASINVNGQSYAVTGIGEGAFEGAGINRVTLSDGITEIGANAFKGCSELISVNLGTTLTEIGAGAFQKCSMLTAISIPAGVREIKNDTFADCTSLTSVSLGLVKTIGEKAFYDVGIKTLKLNDALETIGKDAFRDADLRVVRTGKNLRYVGDGAFFCEELYYFDIRFPRPAESWGENVFKYSVDGSGKPNFDRTVLYRPETLEGWGSCYGLNPDGRWESEPDFAGWHFKDSITLDFEGDLGDIIGDANAEPDLNKIVYDANGVGYLLLSYDTDANDDGIADGEAYMAVVAAYDGSRNLNDPTAIQIPACVWYDEEVFEMYAAIFFTVNNAEQIRTMSFERMSLYMTTTFAAFPALESIYIKSLQNDFFEGEAWFQDGTDSSNVGVTAVWTDKRVVLSESVKYSGASHIYSCFELDDYSYDKQGIYYTIDKTLGVAIAGDLSRGDDEQANTSRYSGSGYYSGESGHAVIPDYVSDGERYYPVVGLGRYAFYNCNSLTKLTLGAFVGQEVTDAEGNAWIDAAIGDCALRNCANLSDFAVSAKNQFYDTDGTILYACSVDALGVKRATKIVKATNRVTSFGAANVGYFEMVSAIENYAFANCTGLVSFDFVHISKIGAHAFENTGLTQVVLNSAEITVMEYAFANNSFLRHVSLGAGTALGRFVFQFCTAIEAFASDSAKYIVDDNGALFEKCEGYAVLLQYPAANRSASSYRITCFTKGGVADSTLPIREIEAYAFYGSFLENITVGHEVWYIGKAAFASSAKLREVTIGKGVVAIGIEIAGTTWWSEQIPPDLFTPDQAQVYEREVFDRCSVLAAIRVDAENTQYCSDTNGILYNADKTLLLVYAEGITRITFTAPITLTAIGIEAFENNVHLQRLILPEGIVEVGAKAFNGCTRLGMIYFRSLTAPKIGEQVFNSTGALNGDEGLTVYCIPEPGEWFDVRVEMWEPYLETVEKYVAIQEVPEQALPTPQTYLVYVIDTDGNTLPGTIVEYGYISAIDPTKTVWKVLTVNDEGYAVLTMPDTTQLFGGNAISLRVTDPKGVFYGFEALECFTPDFVSDYSYITLRSIPGASGLLCQGKDIDTGSVSVNTAGLDEDAVIKLSVRAHWDTLDVFQSVRILQREYFADGTKETVLGSATQSLMAGVFNFEIDPSLVPRTVGVNYEFFVQLTVLSPEGEPTIVEEKLNVDLFYYKMGPDELNGFQINNQVEFEIDPSIPLIGGMEFEAQLFQRFITPSIIYEGDKMYIGINMGELFEPLGDPADGNVDYYKDLLDDFHERIEELKKKHEFEKEASVKVEISGLLELQKKSLNGSSVITRSEIVGTVSYEFEIGTTVFVWVIPVRFEFEFEASGTYRMIMNWENYEENGDFWGSREFELEFNIHAEGRAGLGCSFISVGIYGSADLDIVIAFAKEISGISGEFSMDLGLYIKLDLVFWKVIKHFSANEIFGGSGPLLSIPFECTFWNKQDASGVSTWSLKGDSANRTFASFSEAVSYTLGRVDTTFRPSDTTYEEYVGTESQIVTYKGVTYRFYIDNVYLNKNVVNNGIPYNEYNFLKLVYSTLLEDGSWSSPKIVNKDLFNEVGFDLCVDENGIHIVYRRTRDVMSAANAEQYVGLTEVWQTTLYAQGYTTPAVKLSETASYKIDAEIQSIDGVLYVTWSENADNNIFGMSPDNTQSDDGNYTIYPTTANAICIAVYRNGAWEPLRVLGEQPLIADFEVCKIGSAVELLVLLDADCDMISAEDHLLYRVDLSNSQLSLVRVTPVDAEENPIALTYDENGNAVGQAIASVRCEKGILYLECNDQLYTCTPNAEANWSAALVCEGLGNEYRPIYNPDGSLFGIGFLVQRGELVADLTVIPYVDGTFASPLTLISGGENGIVEFFSTYAYGDELRVLYTLSTANGELRTYGVQEREVKLPDDLILDGVRCENDKVTANEAFDLSLTVTNRSLKPLTALDVILRDPATKAEIRRVSLTDQMILPGSTETLTVKLTLDCFIESYIVEVEETDAAYEESSEEKANNACNYAIVYPDLCVSAKHVEIAGVQYLLILVQNLGELPSAGYTLYVENGIVDVEQPLSGRKLLYTVKNEKGLDAKSYVYYTVELNKVYFTDEYVTFSIQADEAEHNHINNVVYSSMKKHEDVSYGTTYTLTYYVDGEVYYTAEYRVGETIDLAAVGSMEREGYTFSGWYGEKTVMPAQDVEVNGFYHLNTYFVHYYVDGVLAYSDAVEYGTPISVRKNEVKIGHSFSGWTIENADGSVTDFAGGTMPAENLIVEGDFTLNTYTVTYYVNDAPVKTQTYTYGAAIEAYSYPVAEGYQISAWSHSFRTMPAYDVAIYATMQKSMYVLTYQVTDPNGVMRVVYQTPVQYDTAIPYYDFIPALGIGFGGWTDESGAAVTKETNLKMPAKNMTITGRETRLQYTLTYIVNGEPVGSATYAFGEPIVPLAYSKEGYTFNGWKSIPATMPAYNLTVYGDETQDLYEVAFYVDGELLLTQTYPKGATIDHSLLPTKEGYTFGGWNSVSDENGGALTILNWKMPAQNIRVSGSFTANSYSLTYYVDSKTVHTVSLPFGSTVTAHVFTPSEGYDFSGWKNLPTTMPAHNVEVYGSTSVRIYALRYYVDQTLVYEQKLTFGSPIEAFLYQPATGYSVSAWGTVPETMPARDVDLHATTSKIDYTLRYFVDGELVKTLTCQYGDTITAHAYQPAAGRSFLGWVALPEKMPAGNLDVYGSTVIKTYRLDYYVDGQLLYSDLYEYDALIEKRADPTREGYTFSGWGDVARRMPERDVRLDASFTRNQYRVFYYVDGEQVGSATYSYGEKIDPPAYSKEGYTLRGWADLPATMPAQDLTLQANLEVNTYQARYYINGVLYKTEAVAFGNALTLEYPSTENYRVLGWEVGGTEIKQDYRMPSGDIRIDAKVETTETPLVKTVGFAVGMSIAGTAVLTGGGFLIVEFFLRKRRRSLTDWMD